MVALALGSPFMGSASERVTLALVGAGGGVGAGALFPEFLGMVGACAPATLYFPSKTWTLVYMLPRAKEPTINSTTVRMETRE